jgi:hypothetical protein
MPQESRSLTRPRPCSFPLVTVIVIVVVLVPGLSVEERLLLLGALTALLLRATG